MAPRRGSCSASRSPIGSVSSLASGPSGEHKWSSFEIRTLVCLIIKGAYCDKDGPVDPIDFADKLNKALNPVKAHTQDAEALFDRDIPVNDVHKMLRRILAKKRHAVNVIQRDPAAAITRRQINVFRRQLDFDGGELEWLDNHRRENVMAERAEMRRRLDEGKCSRPVGQETWKENQERLRDIGSPRAQKLLSKWSMGKTFFEGEVFAHCGRWTQADRPSRATGPEKTMGPPTRGRAPFSHGPASPGEITDACSVSNNDANEATIHDDSFMAYDNLGNKINSAWDNSLVVHAPAWATPSHSLHHLAATPNALDLAGGWGGGFSQPMPTPQLNSGYGGGYGYVANPAIHGRAKTTTSSHGYGDFPAAAPAYGGAYAVADAASPPPSNSTKMPLHGTYRGSGFGNTSARREAWG